MMTKKESAAKLAKLRTETEDLVRQYNEAALEEKYDRLTKLDADMSEKIGEYTAIVRTMCFEECKQSGDPMMAAVRMLSFVTIGVKDEQKGDEKVKIPVRSVTDKVRSIDLLKLDKYCDGIGHDKSWVHAVQKLNFLLTVQKCKDLGIDPKEVNDSYAMSEIARQYDMGKNPTSKTNLLKTLNKVVTAMLGDGFKATSHDVNFLMTVYARKNRKALTVTTANHRHLTGYLAEICNRIVTGGTYSVEYRKVKDKANPAPVEEPKAEPPKAEVDIASAPVSEPVAEAEAA